MADDTDAAPAPAPRLSLADQAFVNFVGTLCFFGADREERIFAETIAFELAELVNRDHPYLAPILTAMEGLRPEAPKSQRASAITRVSLAVCEFMRWRGRMAYSLLQEQGKVK